jgi:hypothetical protein
MTRHHASVMGDLLGVPFPPTIEGLREQGAEFLTRAFHATGSLDLGNRVVAIAAENEFVGGGMGRKLLLSLKYERPAEGLQEDLFAKFQLDFGNPLRDLFGPLMEAEVRFALLSRRNGFPITVPRCYFADYNSATTSGILITERIPFGEGAVEPRYEKCLDYQVNDPLDHYRSLTRSMGRLAGFHKAGKFGSAVEQEFPFDPQKVDRGNRIPYTAEQLLQKLDKVRSFADAHHHLVPANLRSPAFMDDFCRDVPLVLEFEAGIRSYLNVNPDYIALCHWNMNLDNAWFWTDDQGELQTGLLDWGSVGQMCVAQAFYGMTCCAEIGLLNEHRRKLMALFIEEYRGNGGPLIDIDQLAHLNKLSVALLGVAWMLDAPALIEAQIPNLSIIQDRFDPRFAGNFLARVELQILTVFLNEWQVNNIGGALRAFASGISLV